ncbi:uncharacterized protein GJ701_014286 [Geothlypis trichas]
MTGFRGPGELWECIPGWSGSGFRVVLSCVSAFQAGMTLDFSCAEQWGCIPGCSDSGFWVVLSCGVAFLAAVTLHYRGFQARLVPSCGSPSPTFLLQALLPSQLPGKCLGAFLQWEEPRGSPGTPSEGSFHPFVGLFLSSCHLWEGSLWEWEWARGERAPAWGDGVTFLNFRDDLGHFIPLLRGAGPVCSRDGEAERGSHQSPQIFPGDGARPFPVVPRDRARSSSHKLKHKNSIKTQKFLLNLWKKSSFPGVEFQLQLLEGKKRVLGNSFPIHQGPKKLLPSPPGSSSVPENLLKRLFPTCWDQHKPQKISCEYTRVIISQKTSWSEVCEFTVTWVHAVTSKGVKGRAVPAGFQVLGGKGSSDL